MRFALSLIFVTFLFANESYHKVIKNDRIYHLERYDFMQKNSWIAINHTEELLDIVSDEKSNTLFVKANANNGLGLIEVALIHENRSVWLSYELADEHNFFSIDLEDKDPAVPAVISQIEDGATVRVGKKRLVYNGKRSGSFLVGYLTKEGNYKSKRFVVTQDGIVGFDSYVKLFDTATIPLASSNFYGVEIILGGEKGSSIIKDNQIIYTADANRSGEDKIILSVDKQLVPIILHIEKRHSKVEPLAGSFKADYHDKESFYKEQNGFKHQIDNFFDGKIELKMVGESRKTAIKSSVKADLKATAEGGYHIVLENGEVRVDKDGTVYGKVFENLFLTDSKEQVIEILPNSNVMIRNNHAKVLIDQLAIRVADSTHYFMTLPSSSEIIMDDSGARLELKQLSNNILLPIGVVYGEDDGGVKSLDPSESGVIRLSWSGEIEAVWGNRSYRSNAVKPRVFATKNGESWERFISNGSTLDMTKLPFEKIVEVDNPARSIGWSSNDKKIQPELNTLFRVDSSKLYYTKGIKDSNLSIYPQSVIWQKSRSFVGVASFIDSEIVLDDGCRLLDITGEPIGYYEKNTPYLLDCN